MVNVILIIILHVSVVFVIVIQHNSGIMVIQKKAHIAKKKCILLEYCENKRTYGAQCFSNYWCDYAAEGLLCSTWEPTAGMYR
jgi:hypothetical protein